MGRKLSPKQAVFVAEYLKDANATRAAVAAGYSRKAAKEAGYKLLNTVPAVMEAVAEVRQSIVRKGKYNLKMAMAETERAIEFAMAHKAANAIPRLIELRMKLHGFLIEKIDLKVDLVDIGRALNEAKVRVNACRAEIDIQEAEIVPPNPTESEEN